MSLNDLTNPRRVLIRKSISDNIYKTAAKLIGQTTFEEAVTVRLQGKLRIGAPYPQAIALSFPWQRLALRLATRVPRHVLDAVLRDIRTEDPGEDLKAHVYKMWEDINTKGRKEVMGKVTGSTTIEVLE